MHVNLIYTHIIIIINKWRIYLLVNCDGNNYYSNNGNYTTNIKSLHNT